MLTTGETTTYTPGNPPVNCRTCKQSRYKHVGADLVCPGSAALPKPSVKAPPVAEPASVPAPVAHVVEPASPTQVEPELSPELAIYNAYLEAYAVAASGGSVEGMTTNSIEEQIAQALGVREARLTEADCGVMTKTRLNQAVAELLK